MNKTFYFLKHKETGRFFSWQELCDDGYGQYSANIDSKYIGRYEFPAIFDEPTKVIPKMISPNLEECSADDVEFVKATLSF